MKKYILFSVIILIQLKSSAQTPLTPGEVKAKNETFIVHLLKPLMGDTEKHIIVYDINDKYKNGIPFPKSHTILPVNAKKDIHVNNDTIKSIVYSVLTNQLTSLKHKKEEMDIILVFEPDGKLTDISFDLNANTIISAEDIEVIEKRFRAAIRATFTGKDYLNYTAMAYYPPHIVF